MIKQTTSSDSQHLAVVNIARLHPEADPQELASFKRAADPFMAKVLGSNTKLRAFVDPRESDLRGTIFESDNTMVNLTVWETPQALLEFLGQSHQSVYRRYKDLFVPLGKTAVALWWVPEGVTPDYPEAETRLVSLQTAGPTTFAFGLAEANDFPPSL